MKNEKKKRPDIPGNRINVGRFEFSFPSLSPEDYIAYLQNASVKRLALNTEGRDLKKREYIQHTSFSFRKDTGRIYVWAVGTIYTTNHLDTVVIGELSVERNYVMLILLAPILVVLMKPTILHDLVSFSFGILMVLMVASFWVWIGKRQTTRVMKKVDTAAQ